LKKSSRWRLIDSGPCDAHRNMALDEAIAESVKAGHSPPTLRLYSWKGPSVTLGAFQKCNDVNLDFCSSENIPVVRRPTGGRAILHGNELTYSFCVRSEGPFSRGLLESYRAISQALSQALERSGYHVEVKSRRTAPAKNPLCFQSASFGEISVEGRKVAGSAQRRWPEGLLQQGSIPFMLDYVMQREVFGLDSAVRPEGDMAGLAELSSSFDPPSFMAELVRSFEDVFEVKFKAGNPSDKETADAEMLLSGKYLTDEWNLNRA